MSIRVYPHKRLDKYVSQKGEKKERQITIKLKDSKFKRFIYATNNKLLLKGHV